MRLLGIVAYVERHPGVAVDELAAHFGVSPQQVLQDVDTLWVTGTPGYWPDDLIDFDAGSLESGHVRLTSTRGMGRPLRLGTREAVLLLAALRALEESAGTTLDDAEREVLASTVAALRAVTGEAARTVDVHLAVEADPQVLQTARSALRRGTQVRLRYVDAADVVTERTVDPWQVLTGDERSYLHAWCHSAVGERLFRLDRVLALEETDRPVDRRPGRVRDPGFRPDEHHDSVRIVLAGRARWVAEQLPVDDVTELPDADFRLTLRVGSAAWLRRLLLQVAVDVRAVDPPGAAEEVAAAAGRALARYGVPVDEPTDG